jgi:DNA-binding NarL/FixJ family response regulator
VALAHAHDANAQRRALEELQRLGGHGASATVTRVLRERGASGLPRGPRSTTKNNPAGLTHRELEVLKLVASGLRDAEIAEQLVLSDRTVGHHVSAILGKLSVRSRAEARIQATRLGLTDEDVAPSPRTSLR